MHRHRIREVARQHCAGIEWLQRGPDRKRSQARFITRWLLGVAMVTSLIGNPAVSAEIQYRYEDPGNPGRLTEVVLGNGTRVVYQYDDAGNLEATNVLLAPAQIVVTVDNLDPNTSSTGNWRSSIGSTPWAGNSVHNNRATHTFRWTPNIPQVGTYAVYARWTHYRSRAKQVPYTINHADGQTTVIVNQRDSALASQWNLLGTFDFDVSGAAYVEVSTANGQANADAVRFISAGVSVPKTHDLTVAHQGTGGGIVTSTTPGIHCGTDCIRAYDEGAVVTLTAQPDPGSEFVGWDGVCTGIDACVVTMNAAQMVHATFDVDPTPTIYDLTVARLGSGSGTVTSASTDIHCGTDCTQVYDDTAVVTLTAQPDLGSTFAGWTGACVGTDNCVVTMTASRSVEATFDDDGDPITIVVDNLDPNTSSTGNWRSSIGSTPWAGNSVHNNRATHTFRWTPNIP
ncbi:MAG: hypothetical protein AAF493_13790, partial [Pseudomonadota bacterium]